MGTKNVTWTVTQAVATCDRCDKELGGSSPKRCVLCRRSVGHCCSRLVLAYDPHPPTPAPGPFIDLAFHVCTDCHAAGVRIGEPYIATIRESVAGCEKTVAGLLGRWREWAAELAARKAAGGQS